MTADERASRLLRWYAPSWRAEFGDEFGALLADDITDRPRSVRRTCDVVRAGCATRWQAGGLSRHTTTTSVPSSRRSAWLVVACALFLYFASALWSQLIVDWQWTPPWSTATEVAIGVMSCALGLAAIVAIALVVTAIARIVASGSLRTRRVAVPAMVAVAGIAVLIVGSVHFSPGWPGTSGHSWGVARHFVPGGLGAFSWAATMSVSSYWVHWHELVAFPTIELTWMVVSPIVLVVTTASGALAVARSTSPLRGHASERRLVKCAQWSMIAFVAGAFLWLADDAPRQPHYMFHKGFIDVFDVALVVVTLLVARRVRFTMSVDSGTLVS